MKKSVIIISFALFAIGVLIMAFTKNPATELINSKPIDWISWGFMGSGIFHILFRSLIGK